MTDVEGRECIDGMVSLWNVNVGYGRNELSDAAASQMKSLAFTSGYGGFGSIPSIELAAKLAELAPGDLQVTFFSSGGAEATDTAYKIVRLYWKLRGEPQRGSKPFQKLFSPVALVAPYVSHQLHDSRR